MAQSKKRKPRRNVTVAMAHIHATFNNTTVTITDTKVKAQPKAQAIPKTLTTGKLESASEPKPIAVVIEAIAHAGPTSTTVRPTASRLAIPARNSARK